MNTSFHDIQRVSSFYSPTKMVLGQNTVQGVGEEARKMGGRKAIVVTDRGIVFTGYAKIVEDALRAAQVQVGIFDKVEPEPPTRIVGECTSAIRDGQYDIVIGLGGGSPLDIAKGAAIMMTNPGTIADYAGIDKVQKPGLPTILIPTTAGTGSEASRSIVVTDETDNTKKSIASVHAIADVAILDPMLTFSMPPGITANTGMDALVHAIESYVSAATTPFAEILGSPGDCPYRPQPSPGVLQREQSDRQI